MVEGGYDTERIETDEMRKALEADIEYNTTSIGSNLTTDASFDLGRPQSAELAAMELTHSSDIDSVNEILKRNDKRLNEQGELAVRKGKLKKGIFGLMYYGKQITQDRYIFYADSTLVKNLGKMR